MDFCRLSMQPPVGRPLKVSPVPAPSLGPSLGPGSGPRLLGPSLPPHPSPDWRGGGVAALEPGGWPLPLPCKNPLSFNPLSDNWKPLGEPWGSSLAPSSRSAQPPSTSSPGSGSGSGSSSAPPVSSPPSKAPVICISCTDHHLVTSR